MTSRVFISHVESDADICSKKARLSAVAIEINQLPTTKAPKGQDD